MKLELSRLVKCGEDRGGEDLFLVVRLESEEEPSHAVVTAGVPALVDAALAALPEDEDEDEDLYREGGELRSSPTEYGFQVTETRDGLVKLVQGVALDGSWKKDLASGRYEVEKRIFVDGNAD